MIVLTAHASGQANRGIPDVDVLVFAVSQGRTLVTRNRRHFIRLHRQNPSHRGIIVCTEDHAWAGQAGRIHAALLNCPVLDDQRIRIYRPQTP